MHEAALAVESGNLISVPKIVENEQYVLVQLAVENVVACFWNTVYIGTGRTENGNAAATIKAET